MTQTASQWAHTDPQKAKNQKPKTETISFIKDQPERELVHASTLAQIKARWNTKMPTLTYYADFADYADRNADAPVRRRVADAFVRNRRPSGEVVVDNAACTLLAALFGPKRPSLRMRASAFRQPATGYATGIH